MQCQRQNKMTVWRTAKLMVFTVTFWLDNVHLKDRSVQNVELKNLTFLSLHKNVKCELPVILLRRYNQQTTVILSCVCARSDVGGDTVFYLPYRRMAKTSRLALLSFLFGLGFIPPLYFLPFK